MMRGAVLALALAFCVGLMDIVRTLTHDELQAILSNAEEINEWLVSHRRELHQIPETMYDEVKTSQVGHPIDWLGKPTFP